MAFVVIIDDDSNVRYGLQNLLESAGHDAVGFPSAEDFLDSEPPATVECFVLDINMPGMSGLDLQRLLANRSPRKPVVFVTAHSDLETRTRALSGGAFAFFGKPVEENDLLQSIAAAVHRESRP
jgi:FixJ family two-component response regulator